MTTTSFVHRNSRPLRREVATHLYAVGQAVRLKGNFGTFPKTAEIYHITGMLPPRGDSPQYRIRNDQERHERVTTQDNLDAVRPPSESENATLLERTFGHGQGTKTQQSRDSETETGKSADKGR
ncbi:hypothetical protein [Mesorhizobium sp. 8]|jgi:hypothetical protein|uniref:hypothetical protein n=1 Tax=Mesorhizobium sp. 8 TaxID=2584466 RepID=UPI00111DFF82|nr:hypothetical protein [Mesorhizobium sp. 8]QDC02781.1 hypothetical protein FGU64_21555 [Mesorhizobium sp. 8]